MPKICEGNERPDFQLGPKFDTAILDEELAAIERAYPVLELVPYHDSEWCGIALHSVDGNERDLSGGRGAETSYFRFTPAAELTPYMRSIAEGLGAPLRAVRLLFLPPGGVIHPHTDNLPLKIGHPCRLHVPIRTNDLVQFQIGEYLCNWKPGELWYADFTIVHTVINRSKETRVHLVIDIVLNEQVEKVICLHAM